MDFHLSEEQKMLRDSARDFLASQCPSGFVLEMEKDEKGYTLEFWKKMAELGWMGLIIPEAEEGVGGSFLDLIIMLEEMGRACAPGPFFPTVVLGCQALLEGANDSQRAELLPRIAGGDLILTFAHGEPQQTRYTPFSINTRATRRNGQYQIDGMKIFVPDGHVADLLICVARTSGDAVGKEGISLFLVDRKAAGVHISSLRTFTGEKQSEVALDGVKVGEDALLGPLDQGGQVLERVLQKAAVCKCAEMIGSGQKVLEMASEYAKTREQFGRPIGSFQAVQHHCSNMLMDIEGSRYITYKAAWMLAENIPAARLVSTAKAWVSEAHKRVVALGHQIFGATGYIVEHDMPIYSRRAKAAELAFGDGGYHRKVVADLLGL
jgi:alkylation response protein AidB-like acyl-CoA dehydrogenase